MELNRTFRVGSRPSPLALKQAEEALARLKEFYPHFSAEVCAIDTFGDKDKTTPISDIEGTDFFTREIDTALLAGEIDTFAPPAAGLSIPSPALGIFGEDTEAKPKYNPERSRRIDFAIHSAKDLPEVLPEGLLVAAITEPHDPYDCLVAKNNLKLSDLPAGAKVGASSARRKAQLKQFRPDLRITDIRGNIQERLKKLQESDLEAIIVAGCALRRLGLENRITEIIPLEILKPHPLQGALAVVVKKDNAELIKILSVIDSREAVRT